MYGDLGFRDEEILLLAMCSLTLWEGGVLARDY